MNFTKSGGVMEAMPGNPNRVAGPEPPPTRAEVQSRLRKRYVKMKRAGSRWVNIAGGIVILAGVLMGTVGGIVIAGTASATTPGWSRPVSIDSMPESVSCTSASFCVAVDNGGNAITWNGATWSSPQSVNEGYQLTSVSCTSASFCVAVDNGGNAITWNGATWSSPIEDSYDLNSVSCASSSFCVAVGAGGHVLSYNDASWSLPQLIDPYNANSSDITSVSCTSASFCVAVDNGGNAIT
ncbi:MAG: hypothetical protein ACYDGY_07255, partial [Acidimicrobiales bacterium]